MDKCNIHTKIVSKFGYHQKDLAPAFALELSMDKHFNVLLPLKQGSVAYSDYEEMCECTCTAVSSLQSSLFPPDFQNETCKESERP